MEPVELHYPFLAPVSHDQCQDHTDEHDDQVRSTSLGTRLAGAGLRATLTAYHRRKKVKGLKEGNRQQPHLHAVAMHAPQHEHIELAMQPMAA